MFDIADGSSQNGAKIKVIGVGGGGCNAVNTMIRSGLTGVEYIVANTDSQALAANMAGTKIQLGGNVTKGLGAGANPEVGRKAAIEDYEKLSEVLDGADMVFVTAGMGGGTGTGAAPVIAKLAREMGALTVGVVTKPFFFEGKKRSRQAEEGIRSLEDSVDSLICIPNQRLLQLAGENLSLVDTFKAADEVLLNAVQGISDLINNTGLINADFADVSTVMTNKGLSLMGTGTSTGPERAINAAKQAISSPLLEDVSIDGATGIIINITGNHTLTTHETNLAVTLIMEAADEDAEIIFGTVIDESMGDNVKVTVIATGLRNAKKEISLSKPQMTATPSVSAPVMNTQPIVEKMVYSAPVEETIADEPSLNTYIEPAQVKEEIQKPKINWAEKLQTAASKYESQKNFETSAPSAPVSPQPMKAAPIIEKTEEVMTDSVDYQSMPAAQVASAQISQPVTQSNPTTPRDSKIKSIAEKLGFFNFDEDEFDTPSFMKKSDKPHDTHL